MICYSFYTLSNRVSKGLDNVLKGNEIEKVFFKQYRLIQIDKQITSEYNESVDPDNFYKTFTKTMSFL